MAESKFSKKKVGDEVPGNQTFAVSGKRVEKQCQPCSTADIKTKAKYWCVDCSEYLCSACSKTHTRFAVSKDHTVVAAGNADKSSITYDMKGKDQCKEHNKKIKYVCEDHNKLCCSTRVIANHRKCHNVVEIGNKTIANATDLTSIRRDLLDIESKVAAYAQRLFNIRGKVTSEATKITNKIQEMQGKVNEMFDALKRNVAKELQSFKQQAFHDLDLKNDVCITNTTYVTEALSDVDNVIQQGTPSQQLIMAHHLKYQVMTLKMKIDNDIYDLEDIHMSFDFDYSIRLPPTNNATPGKLTLKYVPADITTFPDKMKYIADDITTCIDSINNQNKDQKVTLTLLDSIDLKQDDGYEEPLYAGLDFLPDGRLVSVDNMNKKCLVYNQKLENTGSVLLPETPYDVTVMNDEYVAVSSGHNICFVKISKSCEVTVTRTLYVAINCESICIMTDDTFLVGCYNDSQPVRVISVEGEKRTLSIAFPSKLYKPNEITCTYIKNRNKFVISDRYAHTVYIYDIDNNTRVEVKDEKIIKKPLDIAVGPADCIFVCSSHTNSIVQISHRGHILSSHALDIWYPYSVCVSKDFTRLAVSNSGGGVRKLQLYSIELIE